MAGSGDCILVGDRAIIGGDGVGYGCSASHTLPARNEVEIAAKFTTDRPKERGQSLSLGRFSRKPRPTPPLGIISRIPPVPIQ